MKTALRGLCAGRQQNDGGAEDESTVEIGPQTLQEREGPHGCP